MTGWSEWGQRQYQIGPQSAPRRRALTSMLLGIASSNFSGTLALWPSCLIFFISSSHRFVEYLPSPWKFSLKSADAEREGLFLFITILRQSNDCWLKDDYCDLQLCCSVAALVSAPLFSSLSSERSLTRFKSPSSTSLVPVFCCSMQQNKIKVTCIYICRWSLY